MNNETLNQTNNTDIDPNLINALELFLDANIVSGSFLQRKLVMGYSRAAKIMDTLESMGYISEMNENHQRTLLITKEDYENNIKGNLLNILNDSKNKFPIINFFEESLNKIFIRLRGLNGEIIKLPLKTLSHTLVLGNSDSEKSNLINIIAKDMINQYSFDTIRLMLINLKDFEYDLRGCLPNYFFKKNELYDINEYFKLLLSINPISYDSSDTPFVIIIDELADLISNNELISNLISLLNNKKYYFIISTQKPNLIPTQILNKITTKICFPINTSELPKDLATQVEQFNITKPNEIVFTNNSLTFSMTLKN